MAQKFITPITVKQLASAGSDAVTVYVDADTQARLKIEAGGRLTWGSGSVTGDVNLYRDSADVLKTDDTLKVPILFVDSIEIDTTGATTNQVLKFDGTKFAPGTASTVGSIDDLSDVTITSPTNGQILKWNGTAWVNDTDVSGSSVNALDDVADVTITSAANNDLLKWNGTAWVNDSTLLAAKAPIASPTFTGSVTLAADPSSALQAATKQYVDNVAAGINFHESVHAASTTNSGVIYNNGTAGVGATLTADTNRSITVLDGESVVVGQRILMKNQTDAKQNGIYTLTTVGSVSAPWVLTRATDADNNPAGEMKTGDFCFVLYGATNGGYGYINNSTANPIVIGTDNITYTVFNAAQALTNGSGINLASNVLSVDTTTIQARVTDVSDTEIGYLNGVTSAIQTQIDTKAPLASPTFTGTPTLPTGTIATTQSPGDNTTAVATTAFVTTAVSGATVVVSSATAPVSPTAGLVWFNTTTGASYIYYNSAWVELGGGTMSPYQATSSTRPSSPWVGQTTYETDTNRLLVWNGSAWVVPNSPAQNPTGLELITTATCSSGGTASGGVITIGSAVSSIAVANAFNSTYDNYKIMISGGVGSTLSTLWLSLGASATGYSSGLFYVAYGATSAQAASDNNSVAFTYAGYATTGFLSFNLDVINPFLAKPTVFGPTNWAAGTVAGTSTGMHNISTSYTAFTITAASGTLTGGTIRVYGYRNS